MPAVRLTFCVAVAAVLGAGCGSSGSGGGVSDAKLAAALDAKTVAGKYAIGGNPFCSISKLLHDADEVASAADTDKGHVIAARDNSVGIVIVTPFAPSCVKAARADLDKLAKQG